MQVIYRVSLMLSMIMTVTSSYAIHVPAHAPTHHIIQQNKNRALAKAAYKGDLKSMQHWIAVGARANSRDDNGFPALRNAVVSGNFDAVWYLLRCNANPDVKDLARGNTPLHFAASNGRSDLVRLLLEEGADPRIANCYGNTPAVFAKNPDIKTMLEYRAAVLDALSNRG